METEALMSMTDEQLKALKPGDKLRCINASGTVLKEGFVYSFNAWNRLGVEDAPSWSSRISLKETPCSYLPDRFILAGDEDKKDTNPKDGAATSRLDLSLFPDTALAYGALALTEGDLKYGGYNWRIAGVKASVYVAALRRHLAKWWNGEEEDPKTGVPHLASVLACVAILVDAGEMGMLKDDRPPKAPVGYLLEEFEKKVKQLQGMFPNGPRRFTAFDTEED